MIRTVFIDAACLVSLINPKDSMHATAINALAGVDGTEFHITDAVLTEVLNYYAERGEYLRR